MNKVVYFILGSIGSGKSEIARRLLFSKKFNVDIYIGSDAFKYKYFNDDVINSRPGKIGYRCADELAFYEMKKACIDGKSFMYELCPTNHNKIESIKNLIKDYGYSTVGLFVGTNDVKINIGRVKVRAESGKDSVSEEKTRLRYFDALGRILDLMHITDILYFVDNSGRLDEMKVVAKHQDGIVEVYDNKCPWFNKIRNTLN